MVVYIMVVYIMVSCSCLFIYFIGFSFIFGALLKLQDLILIYFV
jgi:hypothetical protein